MITGCGVKGDPMINFKDSEIKYLTQKVKNTFQNNVLLLGNDFCDKKLDKYFKR